MALGVGVGVGVGVGAGVGVGEGAGVFGSAAERVGCGDGRPEPQPGSAAAMAVPDVDRPHRIGDVSMLGACEWRPDQEGDVRHAVVDEEAVRAFPVIPEALAVIAQDDEDGAVVDTERLQLSHEAPKLTVGKGNLAVVRTLLVSGREWLGRPVGGVRVVQVNPGKEWRAAGLPNPRQGLVHHFVGRPLDRAERKAALRAQVEVVEIGIESLVDPPLRVEDVGGDEPTGAVAALLEDFGQGDLVRAEEEAAVVADAVLRREFASEDARMGGQRQRRDRHRLVELHAVPRDAVEHRRLDVLRTVGANAVGARRIQRHHDDVEGLARDTLRKRAEVGAAARAGRARARQLPRSQPRGRDDTESDHPEECATPGESGRLRCGSGFGRPRHGRPIVTAETDCRQLGAGSDLDFLIRHPRVVRRIRKSRSDPAQRAA